MKKFILILISLLLLLPITAQGTEVLDEITYGGEYMYSTIVRGSDIETVYTNYISVNKISSSDYNTITPCYRLDKYINGSRNPDDLFHFEGGKTYTLKFLFNSGDSNINYATPQAVYLGSDYGSSDFKPLSYYFPEEANYKSTISYIKSSPNIIELTVILTTAYSLDYIDSLSHIPTNIFPEIRYTGGQSVMELNIGDITVQSDSDGTVYEREVLDLLSQIKANQENYLDKEYDDALSRIDTGDISTYGISDIGDISSISQAFNSIINSISYDGTDCKWIFPASGDIPFIGKLWDEQEIDFNYWMNLIPDSILYTSRFACMFALSWWVIRELRECISIFGGDSD